MEPRRAEPTPAEIDAARRWIAAHLTPAQPPFSFAYDGRSSADVLETSRFAAIVTYRRIRREEEQSP
ncbi:MAG TPA: hypothetical protein VG370_29165 [Chloroflexota bacterium]|jgi:hypothetical protein|nr:hypothetical protein [Chloroflexota bacterium]